MENLTSGLASPEQCPNCDQTVAKGSRFCPYCGQSVPTHRITLSHIAHELVHAVTHVDRSIFGLIGHLARRPGSVISDYLAGKRKAYFNPFTFLLLVATITILVISLFDTFTFSPVARTNAGDLSAETQAIYQRADKALGFLSKYQNILMLLSLPFKALIFSVFYKKKCVIFSEFLVAETFFTGFIMLFSSVIFYPLMGWLNGSLAFQGLIYLMILSHIAYYTLAYCQWFRFESRRERLYALMASTVVILSWSILSQVVIGAYISGYFGG